MTRVRGTEGYTEQSQELFDLYDALEFEELHASILSLIPKPPADILDIGAGTGRDAAYLADQGHRVVAMEPTTALRQKAQARYADSTITWLDDGLPDLKSLQDKPDKFDLIMMTAIWMHLNIAERERAIPQIASLIKPGGQLILTLRHGPIPAGRRMFEVSGSETIALAKKSGLQIRLHLEDEFSLFNRADVTWTRLAFSR